MDITRIQQVLQEEHADGWLFFDFRKSNLIAYQVLSLPIHDMYTRRWFYFVPAQGEPVAIVSAVESHVLRSLPGTRLIYRTWEEMQQYLKQLLTRGMRVAMEYSPMNAIPYIGRVDAGTVELVRSCGVEVVTSANLSQYFVATLTSAQIESHREASHLLIEAKNALFVELGQDIQASVELDEYLVQQRFQKLAQDAGLVMAEPPIVAVNAHASNPHYMPTAMQHSPITRGDLVLFDFWAHMPRENAVYADYTWMAFVGTSDEIPAKQREVFEIVRNARDTGIAFARTQLAAGERVEGRQVDDVVRAVITKAGYGDYFVHRTGHNIGIAEHGNGANIDNYETQDERVLLPNTCCSIEPGIYLPEFGVRSEVNLLIHEQDAEVTGIPVQEEIVALL